LDQVNINGKSGNAEIKIISIDKKEITIRIEGQLFKSAGASGYLIAALDVTEAKQAYSKLLKAESMLSDQPNLILSTTLIAQEKERAKLSSALHDSVCQLLYGIRLNIQNLQRTNGLAKEFININALLDQAISETRQISSELTPSVLKDFGFVAGVEEMAKRVTADGFSVRTTLQATADKLPGELQLYIFRILQELVNNAMKHSGASLTEINVAVTPHAIQIEVADNGNGFNDTLDVLYKRGSGLRGIKNRVDLLNGSIVFKSSPSGLKISADIHLKNWLINEGLI
ncbi:MAG: hypothetical protein EOO89_13230, partial [Pedobacter sp.]